MKRWITPTTLVLGWTCVVCLGALKFWLPAAAQTPTRDHVTCEMQVGDQYRQLLTDQVLQPGAPPAASWQDQVLTLVNELRVQKTQYDIKTSQAQLAERNLATMLNRDRQSQQTIQQLTKDLADLKAELEKSKNGDKPAAN